jgi:hypothetical protein
MGVGIDDNATSTAMTIDNIGRTLINTTSSLPMDAASLSVDAPSTLPAVVIRGNASGAWALKIGTQSTAGMRYLLGFCNNAGATIGGITTNGSSTAYATSSDYRLKENVVPMTGSIDRLKTLKPSRFNFIVDADTTVDGFLAHEAQEVVPEAITGTKDAVDDEGNPDYQGIDQSKLVPLLVASLQEAVARIEALEEQLSKEVI